MASTLSLHSEKSQPLWRPSTVATLSMIKKFANQLTLGRAVAPPQKDILELGEPSNLIFVGGIPGLATESEFLRFFGSFGKLCTYDFPMHELKPSRNRGFAFIKYETIEDATRVVHGGPHVLRSKRVGLLD